MPTYAYACTECHHRFEVVQSFRDDSLTVCPECGGRLRKVFNSVGIVFKGSGFYRTDSRSDGSGKRRSPATTRNGSTASESSPSSAPDSAASSNGGPAEGSRSSDTPAPAAAASGSSSTGSGGRKRASTA